MSEPKAATDAGPERRKFGRKALSPGTYLLDLTPVLQNPVRLNGQQSSFGEAYVKLKNSKINKITDGPSFFSERYVTAEGEILVDVDSSDGALLRIMRRLTELTRQDIDPNDVAWLYYDHDWSCDTDERYAFFAVHGDKIVMEQCNFGSDDPLILKQEADDDPIWHSHPSFDEALEIYWYRKFYAETLMGQLMVLRPDEPILYHYQRPQVRDAVGEIGLLTVAKIYRLVMVEIPLLVALAFPSIRDYAGIAAAALGVEFLLLCWRTRKVGRE
jgi:hypothetical protein